MTLDFPDDYSPLNYCRGCGYDFTSLKAFDEHRAGDHEVERYCLLPEETDLELREVVMGVERWEMPLTVAQRRQLAKLNSA